jgi:molybdopterin synthase catalytic subunit
MQEAVRIARVSDRPLSVDSLLGLVNDPAVGGIVLFVGTVRDHDQSQAVRSLDYTAHPLAEQRLLEVAERAAAVDGVRAVAVEHRVGHLEIGDLAVVIAVGAEHRGEAFDACEQLIDELKAGVPIWKEQTFDDGVSEWVGLP